VVVHIVAEQADLQLLDKEMPVEMVEALLILQVAVVAQVLLVVMQQEVRQVLVV
jgi:hypothetical protein